MEEKDLKPLGFCKDVENMVISLADLAHKADFDGVVVSSKEARLIKEKISKNFIVVTPGIRMREDSQNDQKRFSTPSEALSNGADYIVVGRPIIEASDPAKTARSIIHQMGNAIKTK